MDEVYVSLECTAKLYFKGPQRPVEHRCRLTLGANRHQNGATTCVLTVEGDACQRRTFKITKENIFNIVARLGDGCMTVVFRNNCCDSLVVKEVINRSALTLCHKIISGIWMGVGENLSQGSGKKFNTPPGRPVTPGDNGGSGHQSVSESGKRKLKLNLEKRYGECRGTKMLEAAQSKPATTSSFYKSDSSVVALSEPFIPHTTPTSSPYFQRVARRNLTTELSDERGERGGSGGGKNSTPWDHSLGGRENSLGPRKTAVLARKRLPLGDIEQPRSWMLKDYLTIPEPSNREGFANLGNTCYMNAVLQVLLGLEPFAEDLLNSQLIKRVNPHSLCRMMYLLLKSKRSKDSYDSQKILLKKIKSVIESSRPKFSGYRQQDAHELLTQCLDQLKDDSKPIKPDSDELSECSVCPVVRNFECEMCRSITCKSCGKVTDVSELIYDFALQLPKSVLLRPNEQANLQDLMDTFFVSEEVEYKCPLCSCNSATMSCRLARLPRVMILFLKRYGYNTNLSRNSKRIDFIRIPRFIRVGHLCSEKAEPPSEYRGPWPRGMTTSVAGSDNKENLPSSRGPNEKFPVETFPTELNPVVSVPLTTNGDSGVLGKRRSGEKLGDVQEISCDVMKKQKIEHVLNSDSVSSPMPVCASDTSTAGLMDCSGTSVVNSGTSVFNSGAVVVSNNSVVNSPTSAVDSGSSVSFVEPMVTTSHSMAISGQSIVSTGWVTSSGDSTTISSGRGVVNHTTPLPYCLESQRETVSIPKCVQSSVGRDIAAEFDALFSPEVIFEFENNSSFTTTATAPMTTTAAMTTDILDAATTVTNTNYTGSTANGAPMTTHTVKPLPTDAAGCLAMQTEHPLPAQVTATGEGDLTPGLFGGVACTCSSATPNMSGTTEGGIPCAMPTPREREVSEWGKDKEDEEGLKRAMEESIRDQQSSDVVLLQQMGLSEEEQLKLALELSMQEQSPEDECVPCPIESSSECAAQSETPETHRPETYKLMGIVSHIGKASSGGHYVSDVCCVRDGVWQSYNDCHVSEAREEDIRQRRQGTGYIFFYMHKSILGSICSDKRTT